MKYHKIYDVKYVYGKDRLITTDKVWADSIKRAKSIIKGNHKGISYLKFLSIKEGKL